MKCPICDKEIEDYETDHMGNILMEERATCKDENHFYGYEYVTGNSTENIGDVVFYSHYTQTPEQRKLQGKQYEAVLLLEKENYWSKMNYEFNKRI